MTKRQWRAASFKGKEGGILTVCLLDREAVLDDMTHCDRFEAKDL